MSKYYLIASYYNLHTNTYQNETIIESINGKKLNTLAQIDDLTSNNTSTELFKLIEEETNKTGFNHLSIMYLKNIQTRERSPCFFDEYRHKSDRFVTLYTRVNLRWNYSSSGLCKRSAGISQRTYTSTQELSSSAVQTIRFDVKSLMT